MASGKEYQLAIKIAGKVDSSFNRALSTVSGALGGMNAVMGASVKIAASAFAGIAAATAGIGIASTKVGQEFEAAMDSVAATAHATDEQYAMLEAAAMEMGRTTSKTAAESAAALEYMALAGWSVEDSIAGLPGILHLSEATGLDLARASDLVTDSMAALGLTVDDLSGYLDVAAKANNKSNQTAEQLMEAYLGVGGTMHNLGVPITESATALGVLANRGIKGSEAGTALNAIMVNLTTGTGQAGKAMEALGVSAFDSEGNFIGLEATLQAVNTALEGCTEEQRNAYLAAIGGKHHVDALNDLMAGLNTTLENGNTEWEDLQQNLEASEGALEDMRNTKLDNLAGDLAIFTSALQDAGIKIYKNLQTPLRNAVQFATSSIYKISDALQEGGFTGMAGAIGEVLSDSLLEIGNYASSFLEIVFTISDGLFKGLTAKAPELGTAASNLVSQFLRGFMNFYSQFWTTGALLLSQFLQGMVTQMPGILAAGREAVQKLATGLISQLPSILTAAIQIVQYLIDGLGQTLPTLIAMGAVLLYQLATGLANAAPQLIQHAITAVGYIVQGLIDALPTILAAGVTLLLGLVEGIAQNIGYLVQTGADLITNLIQGLVTMLPVIIAAAGDIMVNLLTGIIQNLPAILQGGVQIIASLVIGIVQAIPTLISTMLGAFQQLVESLLNIDWSALGRQIVDSIKNGIANAWSGLKDFFSDPIGNVTALFSQGGQEAGQAYAEGVKVSYVDIQDAATGITTATIPAFENDTSALQQFGVNASQSLANGITSGEGTLDMAALQAGGNAMNYMVTGMDASMSNVTAAAQTAGAQLANSMGSGVSANSGALTSAISSLGSSASNAASGISISPTIQGASGLASSAQAVTQTATQVKTAMAAMNSAVNSAMSSLNNSVKTGMTGLASAAKSGVTGLTNAVKSGMNQTKTAVTNAMSSVKSGFTSGWAAVRSATTSTFASIIAVVNSRMNAAKQAVVSAVHAMRSSMYFSWSLPYVGTGALSSAINAVSNCVAQCKAMMKFEWSLPLIKLPHFKVTAGTGNYGLDGNGTPPSISVEWYRKGGILDGAQIFGMLGDKLLGGGEAGPEAVLPLSELWSNMRSVFADLLDERDKASGIPALRDLLASFLPATQPAMAGSPAPTYQISFSPVYHFEGEAPSRDEIIEANRISAEEFAERMDQWMRDNDRRVF